MHFADEVLDHLFGDFDVGDHTIAQRADGFDRVGRLAHHHLRIIANGLDALDPVDRFDGNHRRFIQDDALILNVNESVGRTQVDRHVLRPEFEEIFPEAHYIVFRSQDRALQAPVNRAGRPQSIPKLTRPVSPSETLPKRLNFLLTA